MFESFSLDVKSFNIRHSPDVLGLFEPVGAVMFLNVTDEHFDAWRVDHAIDDDLSETFWHETYHCLQVYCTGFCLAHCRRLAGVFGRETGSAAPVLTLMARRAAGHVQDWILDAPGLLLSRRARALLAEARHLRALARHGESTIERAGRFGQDTLWGSLYPGLYAALNEAGQTLRVRGPDGVSAEDVIEGAAFLYGRDIAAGSAAPATHLEDASTDGQSRYGRLVAASLERCPMATSSQIRAAAALALRYEHPQNAVLSLLHRLVAQVRGGDVPDAARALSRKLPALPGAGGLLGTAAQFQAGNPSGYGVYDAQLERLREWPIDEIDLLVEPEAMASVPPGQLGFTLVTKGGPRGPADTKTGRSMVMISTLFLPTGPSIAALRRSMREALAG